MKRIFDLLLGVTIIVLLAAPMQLIAIAVRLTSKGSALYWDYYNVKITFFCLTIL